MVGLLALTGCGGGGSTVPKPAQSGATGPARTAAKTRKAASLRLHIHRAGTLPAPVMDPATAGGMYAGGLNSADVSVAAEVSLSPRPRTIGSLPGALHDAAAAQLGSHTYFFGGGNIGSSATIYRLGASTTTVARLPRAASDVAAAAIAGTAYIVGGYDGASPLDTILAWRPGEAVARVVGHLPNPVRYASVAAVGGKLIVAGGTVGVAASQDVLSFDPASGSVRRIGRLPAPLTHAAAATLRGHVYLFGGRGADLTSQRASILAIDPATGRVRSAGRVPAALSDMGATVAGSGVLLVGGKDASGTVHDEIWSAR